MAVGTEKRFLADALLDARRCRSLGICLGSELIAEAAGTLRLPSG